MFNLVFKVVKIRKKLSSVKLIKVLKEITDNNYNGNNGKYYRTHDKTKSDLDYMVSTNYENMDTVKLISSIIEDNYNQPYYRGFNYSIEDNGFYYTVVVACITKGWEKNEQSVSN